MGFNRFGLSDHVLKGVSAAGYTTPTPIQALAIGPVLEGRDLIGCAQTGTGKTAAFVLPLLHRLASETSVHARGHHVRALVVTPTRELAHQIQDAVATYGRFLTLRAVSVYGGVSMENQVKALRRGVDIVIATPGRLLDHMQRATIDLSRVQILVLDEADRMLDMGFINDVRRIVGALPPERQTLLFSATISPEIRELAKRFQRNPEMVEAGERRNPAETITQHFYSAPREGKVDLLIHAIEAEHMESVLVFSRTKHGADKISRRLERKGIRSMAIHSNRTQSQRQHALDGFKQGRFQVLVATDIAARGIDVEGISHVINYDIPHYAEDYIHRIGRTGRAGASGEALTFVARDDQQHLRKIEQFIGKKLPLKSYPGFTPPPPEAQPARTSTGGPRAHAPAGGTHHAPRSQHPGRPHPSGKPAPHEKRAPAGPPKSRQGKPEHRRGPKESKEGAWSNQPYHGGHGRKRHR
jgi:ATP-dependent RNA helicase RhlE